MAQFLSVSRDLCALRALPASWRIQRRVLPREILGKSVKRVVGSQPISAVAYPISRIFLLRSTRGVPSSCCRREVRCSATMVVKETVVLTEEEERIFETLRGTLQHFGLDTQLRVAGGWVRDKLLGKDSHDIDIALDNLLGRQFGEKVNEYLGSIGEDTHKVGVIASNPEQSKHLETATMRVRGVWVDFVNLRAETYSQSSRIPTMEFGTAKQDALRRDLTINSLFYNINTCLVEDLTGQGIPDLKAGTIRTPLPPKETFLDDPLRVLRSVRFGARFGFELDEELKQAAACEEVQAALATKVSRERIGHEIELMLMDKHPVKAMCILEQLQLFPIIFTNDLKTDLPLTHDHWRVCVEHMQAAAEVLARFEGTSADGSPRLTADQKKLCFLSALLVPLRHVTSPDRKGKRIAVSETIIKISLKLKSDDAKKVLLLHTAAEQFVEVANLFLGEQTDSQDDGRGTEGGREDLTLSLNAKKRVKAGLCLSAVEGLWRTALVLSSLLQSPTPATVQNGLSSSKIPAALDNQTSSAERAERCLVVEDGIVRLGLEDVWTRKPMVNGNEVMKLLGLKNGNSQMREWMDRLKKWELAHPEGTKEECLDWFHQENVKRLRVE